MILVTGAAGQIGSELTVELRRRHGHDKVVAAWHHTALGGPLTRGPAVRLDVTRHDELDRVVTDNGITVVYHLAGVLSAAGEQDPPSTWGTNMDGLLNVLEVARERRCEKVFWPSSIAVFGRGAPRDDTPQDAVLIPSTMYGIAKVAGELLCNYHAERYGLDVRAVRYPGIISSETPPGGGTTDYAVEIFYEAIRRKHYTCFVRPDTVLPMMYMPDCIKAALDLMEAEPEQIRDRTAYNVAAMSFSAEALVGEITKHLQDFTCDYQPDFRQQIADNWPRSIDDRVAREHWGWRPEYGLAAMTTDMLAKLRKKLEA
jgi:nucleoside-diphosphate-sugar epimerase